MSTQTHLTNTHQIRASHEVNLLEKHELLENWCRAQDIDALIVTAQDAFLSEYAPLIANLRYQVSGFSGSTGDGVYVTAALASKLNCRARFHLFVDGRYHLQADKETHPDFVEVHKVPLSSTLDEAIVSWMSAAFPNATRVGVDTQRLSWLRWDGLHMFAATGQISLHGFAQGEVGAALRAPLWSTERPIEALDPQLTGRSFEKNLIGVRTAVEQALGQQNYVFATCMSDDAAWLLNARGFHLPQLSSVLAYTFVTPDACVVHLPDESSGCAMDSATLGNTRITITRGPLSEAMAALRKLIQPSQGSLNICFSGRAMNAALPLELQGLFPHAKLNAGLHIIEELRVAKTTEELTAIRDSFLKSSHAIANTLRWIKTSGHSGHSISETDVANRISTEYGAQGALELSFKTISGFAENGAVIHYSNPSSDKKARVGDLLLLDSGAYYAAGFATDCTRVAFFTDGLTQPAPWQREIYTLTLKSCLAGLRSTFALQTPCRTIDAVCRNVLKDKGYDYAHGTGHGIGIHVHENGIRLSPASDYAFTEHAVVSVEPGVYLSGQGGVRIENVAIVVPRGSSPTDTTHTHTFENIVFVGYDWDLIDLSLLSDEDKADLVVYERACQALGTQVTDCPLVSPQT